MWLLDRLFSPKVLYLKIRPNVFVVKDMRNKKTIERISREPFSTSRLLVGDFARAEQLLRECFRELRSSFLEASPVVLLHPLEMVEGGLSPVEERVLLELAASAGARSAVIWVGAELADDQVQQQINNKVRK